MCTAPAVIGIVSLIYTVGKENPRSSNSRRSLYCLGCGEFLASVIPGEMGNNLRAALDAANRNVEPKREAVDVGHIAS